MRELAVHMRMQAAHMSWSWQYPPPFPPLPVTAGHHPHVCPRPPPAPFCVTRSPNYSPHLRVCRQGDHLHVCPPTHTSPCVCVRHQDGRLHVCLPPPHLPVCVCVSPG